MLTKTLTEAVARGGVTIIVDGQNATHLGNSRSIPYAEMYRERTSLIESPLERLQRAYAEESEGADEK